MLGVSESGAVVGRSHLGFRSGSGDSGARAAGNLGLRSGLLVSSVSEGLSPAPSAKSLRVFRPHLPARGDARAPA